MSAIQKNGLLGTVRYQNSAAINAAATSRAVVNLAATEATNTAPGYLPFTFTSGNTITAVDACVLLITFTIRYTATLAANSNYSSEIYSTSRTLQLGGHTSCSGATVPPQIICTATAVAKLSVGETVTLYYDNQSASASSVAIGNMYCQITVL